MWWHLTSRKEWEAPARDRETKGLNFFIHRQLCKESMICTDRLRQNSVPSTSLARNPVAGGPPHARTRLHRIARCRCTGPKRSRAKILWDGMSILQATNDLRGCHHRLGTESDLAALVGKQSHHQIRDSPRRSAAIDGEVVAIWSMICTLSIPRYLQKGNSSLKYGKCQRQVISLSQAMVGLLGRHHVLWQQVHDLALALPHRRSDGPQP